MASFFYKAKDEHGQTFSGVVEASVERAVIELLAERGLIPIEITQKTHTSIWKMNFFGSVGVKDLILFLRQLSILVSSSVSVVQSLRILVKQTTNERLKQIITEIVDDVDGGARLSQAFGRHPDVFSDFYTNMIKSGETSGRLEEVLGYLADQKEKDYALMSKVKGAMTYPAFVLSSLVMVGIIMMVFVVPKLTAVLTESGTELPFATRVLIGTSEFLSGYWIGILIMMIAAIIGLRFAYKTRKGKGYGDMIIIHIPVFGNLIRKIILVRFTRNLAMLLHGGIPIPTALSLTAAVVGNDVYQQIILNSVQQVEDGNPVASAFETAKEMPVMLTQMMSIGENTGRLDFILDKITAFYEQEIETMVANLVSLIEPMIMVVMGVAVGVMVAAVIMPMYNLASSF